MENQKQSIIDRLKQANNVLVTVSSNPSVDQLSACIGLTLMLNELSKHATAVFSGVIPSTLEFLQPEKTIEKDTDSLRDFIIALDKSKADKLRYKVEDKVVKIFITPYRTSISDRDLQFSQGDFNVDVVVCLGVKDQRDLDQAITSHGRILHDATVVSINTAAGSTLGTLNWQNPQASSLSEMIASLGAGFDKNLLDTQIATALLTGVVAETDRFSNDKTSPEAMKISAQLMAAGANQQLVATKLAEPPAPVELPHEEPPQQPGVGPAMAPPPPPPPKPDDGTLHITHDQDEVSLPPPVEQPTDVVSAPEEEEPQIQIDKSGQLHQLVSEPRQFLSGPGPSIAPSILPRPNEDEKLPSDTPPDLSGFALNQPMFGGTLTANSHPEEFDPTTDPLSQHPSDDQQQPILTHNNSSAPATELPAPKPPKVIQPLQPTPPASTSADDVKADSPIPEGKSATDVAVPPDESGARSAVESAINEAPETQTLKPRDDLSAKPLGEAVHDQPSGVQPAKDSTKDKGKKPDNDAKPTEPLGSLVEPLSTAVHEPAPAAASPSARPLDMPLPQSPAPSAGETPPPVSSNNGTPLGPPPPVPPPIVPQFGPSANQ